jgi:hypothetical protein
MEGYYHCRRKRDGEYVVIWFYKSAAGEQRCSCARTHECDPRDFEVLDKLHQFNHPALVVEPPYWPTGQ